MEVKVCGSLEEVRNEIDLIDEQLVALIAKRNAYVHQAAKFKVSIDEVKANERVEDVISRARSKALDLGVSPNMITAIFTMMIDKMVEAEISEFQNAKNL